MLTREQLDRAMLRRKLAQGNITIEELSQELLDDIKDIAKEEAGYETALTTAFDSSKYAAGHIMHQKDNVQVAIEALTTEVDHTATTSKNGLMSSGDKSKLDGIETGANKYIHPSTHDAGMITESATKRFVTDTEKSTWNAKASQTDHNALASKVTTAETNISNLTANKADKSTMTTELGKKVDKTAIGTAASKNVGTSSGQVPVLDANGKLATSILPSISTNESFVATSISDAMSKPCQIGDLVVLNASTRTLQDMGPYNEEVEGYLAAGIMTYICISSTATTFEEKFRPLQSAADTISKGEVDTALNLKADKTTVSSELAKKANLTDHNTLAGKVTTAEGKISALETTVGNSTSGLVKKVNDNVSSISKEVTDRTNADKGLSDRIDSLNSALTTHNHTIAQVSGLQAELDKKATKAVATTSADGLMSAADKTKVDGIASGAEVNQNAFSNVKVGSTTVTAKAKTDTVEFKAGSNISLTADATAKTVTINNTYSYTHPTSDGNKHVPANGTSNSGKFLQASATAGTYQWASLPEASTSIKGILKLGTAATDAAAGNHTHAASTLTQDASNRFVTDTQINTWNAKASTAVATTSANGLMASADKAKLDKLNKNDAQATGDFLWSADRILQEIAKIRVAREIVNVTTTENNQKNIVFTSSNYIAGKTPIEVRIGSVIFNESRYTVSGNTITLKSTENGISLGRKVEVVIYYMTK